MSTSMREIAHLWVHQTQERARSGSVSFVGTRFFSYATCIGELVDVPNVGRIAIMATRRYSNTTSKHQSRMRMAASHLPFIDVNGGPCGTHSLTTAYDRRDYSDLKGSRWAKEVVAYSIEQCVECMEKSKRASTYKDMHIRDAEKWMQQAHDVCNWFRVRMPAHNIEDLCAKAEKARIAEAKRAALAQKKREKENKEKVEEWLAGAPVQFPHQIERIYVRTRTLRATSDHDGVPAGTLSQVIETSTGAFVPYSEGKRLFEFATKMRERGWHRNGEQFAVGHYQLDAINEFGVVIGCHRISWGEAERFAKQQGWLK